MNRAEEIAKEFATIDYEAHPFGVSLETIPLGGWPTLQKLKIKRAIRALVGVQGRLLDIGCGGGQFIRTLSGHLPGISEFVGTDLSATAIKAAQDFKFPKCQFVLGQATSLPFPDRSFDAVTAMDVLEHVRDTQGFLSEIRRVLKPGGLFVFHVPCEGSPWTLGRLMTRFRAGIYLLVHWAGHERYFKTTDIERELDAAGFRFVERRFSYHPVGQIAFKGDLLYRAAFTNFKSRRLSARLLRFGLVRGIRLIEAVGVMESRAFSGCRFAALGLDGVFRKDQD